MRKGTSARSSSTSRAGSRKAASPPRTSARCSTTSRPACWRSPTPRPASPLVERVYERDELYHGPHAHLAPDLTVVLGDWRYRTIGLHDFTTNQLISPAFGPTGDHRMEGVLVAAGPPFRAGATPEAATLLDIAPTVLHLLGVPVPDDMDGRVLTEILDPAFAPAAAPARRPRAGRVAYADGRRCRSSSGWRSGVL